MVLARELGLLAIYLHREDGENALRKLEEVYNALPPEAREEIKDAVSRMREYVSSKLWEDAWRHYQVLVDVVGRYDPVISAYVTSETYEAYEKAAGPEETVSSYARRVLEGGRAPATTPDGVRATSRVGEELAKSSEADWEKRLREHLASLEQEADWERELEELMKPSEADWEKRLKEATKG